MDGIESFMVPLTEEVIEKADALLKVWEDASTLTTVSYSIHGWLEKAACDPPSSITKVYHPLASSPTAVSSGETIFPVKAITEEPLVEKIKEEPMFPESGLSTPISADFTDPQLEAESPDLGKRRKIPPSPKRPQPIGANAPTAAP